MNITEPYKGLQPYEEENKDIFFGRDAEREILINKIFSNKLTLLFAASGVGKSSLLQAAVLPELKRPDKENLDVVYYRDWVSDPMTELKKAVIDELRKQGKLSSDYSPEPDLCFKEFFEICSAFSSEPMVVMLDQFEEFFQYRRYFEGFKAFVGQMSDAFNDRQTPVVFVISMREDFALELNEFKPFLPTTIFENYFRIEKLGIDKAELAIRKPVEKLGFQYEEELLTELLKDLAKREKQARFGSKDVAFAKDAPAFVEPPYLQIVCTHLWNKEKDNPDKIIRARTYQDSNKAEGIVGSYFDKEIGLFSASEKRIASKAFDHLVTPYGTKMAYPVKDLSGKINEAEKELEQVLEKLQKARILRSQKREGIVWYELYHDIFSKIIYKWNEKYKARQRNKKAFKVSILAALVCLMLYLGYDAVINYTSHHFSLSAKSEISDTVEVYRGKADSRDIFGLQKFEAEMNYERNQIEPDRRFDKKQIDQYEDLNNELIAHLPSDERVLPYTEHAEIQKALDLADKSISDNDTNRTNKIIHALSKFKSEKTIELLDKYLKKLQSVSGRAMAAYSLGNLGSEKAVEPLIALLRDQEANVRRNATEALVSISSEKSVEPLIALLKDNDEYVRRNASAALINLGSEKSVEPLIVALKDKVADVRMNAAYALGKIGSEKAIEPLIVALKDQSVSVRKNAAEALGNLHSEKSFAPLIMALKDQDTDVRKNAAEALANFSSIISVEPLISVLKDQSADVRKIAAEALGNLRSEKSINPLIAMLKDQNADVRRNAAKALGNIRSEKSIEPLIMALKDKIADVRMNAAEALGNLRSEKSAEPLIMALKDNISDVRRNAAEALGNLRVEKSIKLLIDTLGDQNAYVRRNAAYALGKIGSEKSLEPLIVALKDQSPDVRRSAAYALGKIGSEKSLEILISMLKDQDPYIRRNGAEALINLGSTKSVDPLIAALEDYNADVRKNAIEALGKIGSLKSLDYLIAASQDNDADVRMSAAEALENFNTIKSVERLIAMLSDLNADVRSTTASVLGKIGSDKAIEPLITALKDKDANVRKNATSALVNLGSQISFEALIVVLRDRDATVRKNAAYALGNLGSTKSIEHLITMLKDQDVNVRKNTAHALGNIRSIKSVDYLLAMLKDQDTIVTKNAVEALGNLGADKAVDPLITILKAQNVYMKSTVSDALKKLGVIISPTLISENMNNNEKTKDILIEEETKKEGSDTFDAFKIIVINKQESVISRLSAITGLGNIKTEEAINLLMDILEKETENYQFRAIQALGNTGNSKALPALQKHLEIEEKKRIEWRKIRDEKTGSYTEPQMEDWRKRLESVKPKPYLECELAYAIARIAPDTEGIRLLNHDLAAVREGAWLGIGKVGTVDLLKKLYEERRRKDITPWFRHAAYRAIDHVLIHLEAFGNTKDADELEKFLKEEVKEPDEPGVHTRTKWTMDRLREERN